MHSAMIFTTALSLLSLGSAASVVKARQDYSTSAQGSGNGYSLTVTSQLAGTQYFSSDANGNIDVVFQSGDVVASVDLSENSANTATCFAKDKWGNQVRNFGGQAQPVTHIDFNPQDGKQIATIDCEIVGGSY
jgi:hypothetical protein